MFWKFIYIPDLSSPGDRREFVSIHHDLRDAVVEFERSHPAAIVVATDRSWKAY